MRSGIQTRTRKQRQRLSCHSTEPLLVVVSVACLSVLQSLCFPTASSLVIHPLRHYLISRNSVVGGTGAFPTPLSLRLRMDTKLKNKHDNNISDDDFASFNDFDQGAGDEGRELAQEFYQELENRHGQLRSESENDKDETYAIRSGSGTNPQNEGSQNTIRTVRIRANGNGNSASSSLSSGSSRRSSFTNQPSAAKTSSQESSPIFSLFPFFSFPALAPRPATSAGLFSGSGTTVYSSGRSIRAEIEILETTLKKNEAAAAKTKGWDGIYVGSPEQLEEVFRVVALSLFVLSAAYIAVEVSGVGVTELFSWDSSSDAVANHLMSLMNDATKDGMSSIMITVSNSEVFMSEEAGWLMKESSDLASSVVEAARSVEELVLS